jgi:thiol-disulfide isomerase/thioredoxin
MTRTDAGTGIRRRTFLAAVAGAAVTGAAGCTGDGDTDPTPSENDPTGTGERMDGTGTGDGIGGTGGTATGTPPEDLAAWRTSELTDVRSDETFTIRSLDGPVAIQSFAVWCPKCERQSNSFAELGGSVTRVSLNTDPNEDAGKVEEHAADNGFDWRFAVAPTGLTDSLIDAFGTGVAVAPSTPVIVACEGGAVTYRDGNVLSASEIESIASDC